MSVRVPDPRAVPLRPLDSSGLARLLDDVYATVARLPAETNADPAELVWVSASELVRRVRPYLGRN